MNTTAAIFTLTMTVITPNPSAPLGVDSEKTHKFQLTEPQCLQMKDRFYKEAVKNNQSILVKCEKATPAEEKWTRQQYNGKPAR